MAQLQAAAWKKRACCAADRPSSDKIKEIPTENQRYPEEMRRRSKSPDSRLAQAKKHFMYSIRITPATRKCRKSLDFPSPRATAQAPVEIEASREDR
jgi:hypothetical protein